MTKRIVQLVDSLEYARNNCFQHQLLDGLGRAGSLWSVSLADFLREPRVIDDADAVLSCLRMRTLDRHAADIGRALAGRAVVVYEQDPWESFKADGACSGAYARVADAMNVRFFAVTTHAWEARLKRLGFNSRFVRMGMLPAYCTSFPGWHERPVDVGFVGQLHPYRLELFEALRDKGIRVQQVPGGSYQRYLTALSSIKVFVHRETGEYEVAGERVQYAEGLWVKDIEAIARGCISVRNFHPDAGHHVPDRLIGCGLRMFEDGDVDTAARVIADALREPIELEPFVDFQREREWCTQHIVKDDAWLQTAKSLIDA